jgi:hypothetical protein
LRNFVIGINRGLPASLEILFRFLTIPVKMVAPRILDVHGEKEVHLLEEELHVEILPGTEIMADFGTHHSVKQTGTKVPVLVPPTK